MTTEKLSMQLLNIMKIEYKKFVMCKKQSYFFGVYHIKNYEYGHFSYSVVLSGDLRAV